VNSISCINLLFKENENYSRKYAELLIERKFASARYKKNNEDSKETKRAAPITDSFPVQWTGCKLGVDY
jgi:hypothetical protein